MLFVNQNRKIIFLVILTYFINQIMKKSALHSNFSGYFFRCYFNDLLCGLAFPAFVNELLIINRFIPIQKLAYIILEMFCCGLIWEYVAPQFVPTATSDPIDILCYILGGIFYWVIAIRRKE